MTQQRLLTRGVLELHPRGYGFLRDPARSYATGPGDAYVPTPLIQRHGLREGLQLAGPLDPPLKGNAPRLVQIDEIEGAPPTSSARAPSSN